MASFQGDGVLAFFGYPSAHETDAERGIRAALELAERVPSLPELPTAAEAGLPGYESQNWHAVFVAAGTPAPLIARLEGAARAAVASPATNRRLVEAGVEPRGTTAAELEPFWDAEMKRWLPIVRASGATVE